MNTKDFLDSMRDRLPEFGLLHVDEQEIQIESAAKNWLPLLAGLKKLAGVDGANLRAIFAFKRGEKIKVVSALHFSRLHFSVLVFSPVAENEIIPSLVELWPHADWLEAELGVRWNVRVQNVDTSHWVGAKT